MSLIMRKPIFCICEADQRLCFRYTDSTIPLLPIKIMNFKPPAIFYGCTARFISDLVGNPEDRFSHNEAHMIKQIFGRNMLYRKQQCNYKS